VERDVEVLAPSSAVFVGPWITVEQVVELSSKLSGPISPSN
jgi:hypothetical protein